MQNFIDAYSWINVRFLLQGLWITIEISVASIVISFIVGTLLGIIRYAKIKYVSAIVGFIIDIIRNLPLLLIIFFTYFGLPNIGIKPEIIPAAIMAMSIFESAMVAEIVRSGINSIDKGQTEGALANGLTRWQALRIIVLPQAIKNMTPALVSQFISLVKDIYHIEKGVRVHFAGQGHLTGDHHRPAGTDVPRPDYLRAEHQLHHSNVRCPGSALLYCLLLPVAAGRLPAPTHCLRSFKHEITISR